MIWKLVSALGGSVFAAYHKFTSVRKVPFAASWDALLSDR